MTDTLSDLIYEAVDLSRLRKEDLVKRPQPPSAWPKTKIRLRDVQGETCIASWRRDVLSGDEISNRLSECAWDGITMGFRYMLADLISLRQDDPLLDDKIIEFSQFYGRLHAVIAYQVDPDIQRPWLRNEAVHILGSPTQLPYVQLKWKLRLPLLLSLTINQICTRRLGLFDINTSRLFMCDSLTGAQMRMCDLNLAAANKRLSAISVINLDRRHQLYASDVALIYEINQPEHRPARIAKLQRMRSNSIVVPALLAIWSMIEGLSLSVRGVDWPVPEILHWIECLMRTASGQMLGRVGFKTEGSSAFTLFGEIKGTLRPDIQEAGGFIAAIHKIPDMLVRCRNQKAENSSANAEQEFLEHCLDAAVAAIHEAIVDEPRPLSDDAPQYSLGFDDREHHDDSVIQGPSTIGEVKSTPMMDVAVEELRLFDHDLQKAFANPGMTRELDVSMVCDAVGAHKSASHRYALLLCSHGAESPASLRLAQLIGEAWQAEFRSRSLRDVVDEVAKQIAAGKTPSLEEIADMVLKRSFN